ncbi:MAG: hypothetical protein ABJ242_05885 [Marinomonas sp.]
MDIELHSAIKKAKNTQKNLVRATNRAYDYRELVELRGELQADLLLVSKAILNDPILKEDPTKQSSFSKRHHEAQNALSQHQARWSFVDIENDWQSYQQATSDLRRAQDDYFSWAMLECIR